MATIISTKELCREYRSGENVCMATNQVHLSIEKGQFLSIMGPSGSGKSTLLQLLANMQEPTSGSISYQERDITQMSEKEKAAYRGKEIGFVFQEHNLLEDFNVLQNIALPGYLYAKRSEVEQKARRWLAALHMEEQEKKNPAELSGGQRQRVAIARALINEPKVLFLDEPTGSLDKASGEQVLDLLEKLNKMGQTIVMVTHDEAAARRANRIIYIRDGKVDVDTDGRME